MPTFPASFYPPSTTRLPAAWSTSPAPAHPTPTPDRAGERSAPLKRQYEWVEGLDERLVAGLHALPFTLRLPTYRALVVHAGLVPGAPLSSQRMGNLLNLRGLLVEEGPQQQAPRPAPQQQDDRQSGEAPPPAGAADEGRGAAGAVAVAAATAADAGRVGSDSAGSSAADQLLECDGSSSSSSVDDSGLSDSDTGCCSRGASRSSSIDVRQPACDPSSPAGAAGGSVLTSRKEGVRGAHELFASGTLSREAGGSVTGSGSSGGSGGASSGASSVVGTSSDKGGSRSSGGGGTSSEACAPALPGELQPQVRRAQASSSPLLLIRPHRPAAEEDVGTLFARPPQPPPGRRWVGSRDGGQLWAAVWRGPEHLFFGHDARRVGGRVAAVWGAGAPLGCCRDGRSVRAPRGSTSLA